MKRSVATLVAAIGLIVAVMLVLAVWVRFTLPPAEDLPTLSGQRATKSYDLASFTDVKVSGQWQITLVRGDAWAVEIAYPLELERLIDVRKDGDRLVLGYTSRSNRWSGFGSNQRFEMSARIVMPALEELDLSGAMKLELSGFEGPKLEVDASGASSIEGKESRYRELELSMSGAGSVDFGGVTTTDADVNLSGAQHVTLRMAGGSLSGTMSGASNLEYFGTIAAQNVSTSGFTSIDHRD